MRASSQTGELYRLIARFREQEGKQYPVELNMEIWAKNASYAKLIADHMGYEYIMLARATKKAKPPAIFKPTYN